MRKKDRKDEVTCHLPLPVLITCPASGACPSRIQTGRRWDISKESLLPLEHLGKHTACLYLPLLTVRNPKGNPALSTETVPVLEASSPAPSPSGMKTTGPPGAFRTALKLLVRALHGLPFGLLSFSFLPFRGK